MPLNELLKIMMNDDEIIFIQVNQGDCVALNLAIGHHTVAIQILQLGHSIRITFPKM